VRLSLRVRSAVALAVASAAVTTVNVAAASGRPVAVANPPQAAAAAAGGRPVLLINGDRLLVRPAPGGRSAVVDLSRAGGHTSLVVLHRGQLTEVIPADALPYLGKGLDPSLFDLGLLERAESGGRLPVRLTFRGPRPALPGVTITGAGRGSAEGYLTDSSARAFGAVLRGLKGQPLADGARLGLAGVPAARPPARPLSSLHTLKVTASNLSGRPDNGGTAWVFDASSLAAFGTSGTFAGGAATFRVPAGRYWVIGDFDGTVRGRDVRRLAFLPEFAVGRNTTVHVAERAANSKVTIMTPRPAVPQVVRFTDVLRDQHGSTASIGWFSAPGTILVSPVRQRPDVGTVQAYTFEQLTSPAGAAGPPYVYNLDFRAPAGIIPVPHYRAVPSHLATVAERYYQEVRSAGDFYSFGAFPNEGLMAVVLGPMPLPGRQTQYFTANPALLWSSSYFAFGFPLGGQGDDTYRALSPGRQVVDWNRYPLHPQPNWSAGGAGGALIPLIPAAIRSGNRLTLTIAPFSDNQPGHRSAGSAPGTKVTERFEIDQNGVRIARGNANGVGLIPPVTLSQRPSMIRFTLDAARTGPSYRLSTRSHTVWTWRSRRRPAAIVSRSWYCAQVGARLLRRCAVQPMMTLDYQVRGLALNGTTPPGPQLVRLHVGHLQLAPAPPVTSTSAWVSCDDGASWRRAAVTAAGGGNFRIAFSRPRGCRVTLRVRAADAAGGSVTETVTRAWR
jgi:hypothetical protein